MSLRAVSIHPIPARPRQSESQSRLISTQIDLKPHGLLFRLASNQMLSNQRTHACIQNHIDSTTSIQEFKQCSSLRSRIPHSSLSLHRFTAICYHTIWHSPRQFSAVTAWVHGARTNGTARLEPGRTIALR
eukprot:2146338-Rhodomonas_salina.1